MASTYQKSLKCDYAYDFLRQAIERGDYLGGDKLPSGKELAKDIGCSHPTMRKALASLEQDGFITQIHGRGIFANGVQRIREALVLLDYANDIHAIYPLPIQNALLEAGYVATFFDVGRVVKEPRMFREVVKARCDLLLFDVAIGFPWEMLDDLPAGLRKVNFHRDGFNPAPFPCSKVLCDHRANGRAGMEALLERGCTRPAIFSGTLENDSPVNNLFLQGALDALKACGLEAVNIYYHDELTQAEEEHFFRECDGCLAILDSQLVQICRGARQRKLSLPGDLLLVGRNNTPWAVSYNLSSVDPQPWLLAEELVKVIRMEDDNVDRMIPPNIIWRESCPLYYNSLNQ